METKKLPILEKVALWSAIFMEFQKYSDFEGVFYKSGMTNFKIQVDIIRHKQKSHSFDIIAADDSGNCCNVEVTTNREKDISTQLRKHAEVPPSEIMEQIGLSVHSSPDVISCANFDHEVNFCYIVIMDNIRSVHNLDLLNNTMLAENLKAIENHHGYPTSTKFTLVPEPNEYELRSGISSILFQMSYLGSTLDSKEIVNQGLDYLSEHFGFDSKRNLMERVDKAMDALCEMMPYAFKHEGHSYRAIPSEEMGRKKSTYSNDLKIWMESPSKKQKKIDEFPSTCQD